VANILIVFYTKIYFYSDQAQAETLTGKVNEAVELLNDYNGRLLKEMEDRKTVTKMLHDFTAAQKELLVQAEERLQVGDVT
jgi:regulator of Ty1 transposition protein 103